PIKRRRQDLAEGSVQERERRRGGCGDRSGEFAGRLRVALEYSASTLVHLSAVERARRRDLQICRWRDDVEPTDGPFAGGVHWPKCRGDLGEQSAARVRSHR